MTGFSLRHVLQNYLTKVKQEREIVVHKFNISHKPNIKGYKKRHYLFYLALILINFKKYFVSFDEIKFSNVCNGCTITSNKTKAGV